MDIVNLIEEVEDLARRERQELKNHLRDLLNSSPGLKSKVTEYLVDCYEDAKDMASKETGMGINTFPSTYQYSESQILDKDF